MGNIKIITYSDGRTEVEGSADDVYLYYKRSAHVPSKPEGMETPGGAW